MRLERSACIRGRFEVQRIAAALCGFMRLYAVLCGQEACRTPGLRALEAPDELVARGGKAGHANLERVPLVRGQVLADALSANDSL